MADDMTCAVCGESVDDPALLSDCRSCGDRFHLNPRADIAGIDCGDVWTGDSEAPALQFYCRPCIDRSQAAAEAQAQGVQAAPAAMPPMPPGAPPLPPGAPPEMLAAMAGWATPTDPAGDQADAAAEPAADSPPPPIQPALSPRARRRRRFRRVDTD